MNYCGDFTNTSITPGDVAGLRRLYPSLPLLEQTGTLPVASVMAGSRLTVFALSTAHSLAQTYYENNWTPWKELDPSEISGAPAAAMLGNRLTVFAADTNGHLLNKWYDNGAWSQMDHIFHERAAHHTRHAIRTVGERTTHGIRSRPADEWIGSPLV
jgi:hypothetical protein